jgi:hypothetical protein
MQQPPHSVLTWGGVATNLRAVLLKAFKMPTNRIGKAVEGRDHVFVPHVGTSCWHSGAVTENVKEENMGFVRTVKAILTDAHFVIPVIVLLIGIILLVKLH